MKNQIKTILLLGVLSTILIGFGAVLGRGWIMGFTILAIALNFGAYFFSHKIVLRMHRAEPIGEHQAPRIYAIVRELAREAAIPMPSLYRIPSPQPNAFATGRNPKHGIVAVTDGIVELLTERELRGVLAHEIAHIRNRDILVSTIAATIAAAVAYIANMLQFTAIFGGGDGEEGANPLALLAIAIVAPIAAMLVQFGISRSREYLADETGGTLSRDPEALASALARMERAATRLPSPTPQPATASLFIVNPFAGGGQRLARLFSTHPPSAERIRRLHAMKTSEVGIHHSAARTI